METKQIIADLFAEIEAVKAERLRAGTRFRLMAVTADIADLTRTLQQEVLGIASKWKVFEQLWHRKNMRNDYNTALEQQQRDEYRKKKLHKRSLTC